jgi:hypothetical protein
MQSCCEAYLEQAEAGRGTGTGTGTVKSNEGP